MSSTELIKKLRETTGAGIFDIKQALEQSGGNEEKTIEILRKAGQKIALKKSARETKEGLIGVYLNPDLKSGTLVAVACETDFVARNEDFRRFVSDLTQKIAVSGMAGIEKTIAETIAKIGENIQLKEIAALQVADGLVDSYIHTNGKVGVLVAIAAPSSLWQNDELKSFAHKIALQVAAVSPKYLSPQDVPAEIVSKEKEIYREQLKREGKPEPMIEKIIEGKLQKFYSEVCLLKQIYIKDDKITIEKLLEQTKKKLGTAIEIKEFVRMTL